VGTPNDLIGLLRRAEVEAVQIEKPGKVKDGPWTAGVKRAGKWSWWFAPTPADAVEKALLSLATQERAEP
jgi:hypothetical protein